MSAKREHRSEPEAKQQPRRREATTPGSQALVPGVELAGIAGNRAFGRLLRRSSGTELLSDRATVIRRHDAHNNARLTTARTAVVQAGLAAEAEVQDAVRLDHTMSENHLRALAATLWSLRSKIQPPDTRYVATRGAMATLRATIGAMDEAAGHPDWDASQNGLAGLLANLRANLVPGLIDTVGNPGDDFDQALAKVGDQVTPTAASDHLLSLDTAARKVGRLETMMPSTAGGRIEANYDAGLDQAVAARLGEIIVALSALRTIPEPIFNPALWEKSGESSVKLPAGERITEKPAGFMEDTGNYPALARAPFNWDITVPRYRSEDNDATVAVAVTIDVDAWKHIYDRHTFGHFAGTVQATNTFWDDDPRDAIDQALLKAEIGLLIDREFNLFRFVEEADDRGEEDRMELSEAAALNGNAENVFVQGTMDLYPDYGNADGFTIDVTLRSVAPESYELGRSVSPEDLTRWKEEREAFLEQNPFAQLGGDLFD